MVFYCDELNDLIGVWPEQLNAWHCNDKNEFYWLEYYPKLNIAVRLPKIDLTNIDMNLSGSFKMSDLPIRMLAKEHNNWLIEMGWNKTNALEQLALIASEIGEAVNECRGEKPTEKLGSELADLILRVFGMAEQFDINIEKEILTKMSINFSKGNFKGRLK